MIPSALVIPALISPGMVGALFQPAGLLGLLGALVVIVAGGLCLAIVSEDAAPTSSSSAGRPLDPVAEEHPLAA